MSRFFVKPSSPVFNRADPLAVGCVAFWPFNEPDGDAVDIVQGIRLTRQTSAGRTTGQYGRAGNCSGSQVGFAATAPQSLRLNVPITIACVVRYLGTPSNSTEIFGVTQNNTASGYYLAYSIGVSGGGNLVLDYNNGSSYRGVFTSTAATLNQGDAIAMVALITPTTADLYRNGVLIGQDVGFTGNPSYDATATVVAGFFPAVSRDANIAFMGGGIWSRTWSLRQIQDFTADPFRLIRPPSRVAQLFDKKAGASGKTWLYRPSTSVVYGYGMAGAA